MSLGSYQSRRHFFFGFWFFSFEHNPTYLIAIGIQAFLQVDEDMIARLEGFRQQGIGLRLFHHLLDYAANRPGTHLGVKAFIGEVIQRGFGGGQR